MGRDELRQVEAELERQLCQAWLQGYEAARGDVAHLLRPTPLRRPVRPLARLLRAAVQHLRA